MDGIESILNRIRYRFKPSDWQKFIEIVKNQRQDICINTRSTIDCERQKIMPFYKHRKRLRIDALIYVIFKVSKKFFFKLYLYFSLKSRMIYHHVFQNIIKNAKTNDVLILGI